MQLRIGTRGSALARWQADWVAAQLRARAVDVELVHITTRGDQQQGPIGTSGVTGIFTKEIQRALLDGRIDVAVHSLKDLPTDVPAGLCLAATPERASVADVLVAPGVGAMVETAAGGGVATGSLRRRAQLLHARNDLLMCDIRGNVETRLRKLQEGGFDAVILAEAGLRRLGLEGRISEVLPLSLLLPAIGQGALGIEARADDPATRQCLQSLDHAPTHSGVTAERRCWRCFTAAAWRPSPPGDGSKASGWCSPGVCSAATGRNAWKPRSRMIPRRPSPWGVTSPRCWPRPEPASSFRPPGCSDGVLDSQAVELNPVGGAGCARYDIYMTSEHFDKTFQAYQRRRPFRSFTVRFVSGEHIDVDHPEALVTRGGVAVYLHAAGVPTLFDHESVSEVVGESERRTG